MPDRSADLAAPLSPAKRPPIGRVFLVLPIAALVTGGACLSLTLLTPEPGRALVAWSLGTAALLLSLVLTIAVYAIKVARHHKNHTVALSQEFRDRLAEAETDLHRLADATIPKVARELREGASVDTALSGVIPTSEKTTHHRIVETFAHETSRGERARTAAMSACANAAGRVQALRTKLQADLREMQERYEGQILSDLLRLDHQIAQAGRVADSIAVLTGARSGRRWPKPIVMESVLRGALARIQDYQRVRIHSTCNAAMAGHAAEGVMHVLAELADNATSFSPPSDEVHIYVEEVQAGVVVTIEDSGLAMKPAALARAERAVSAETLDLTTLSGTRLGLAVVGCLARKHGLTVSFRPSSRGGTGVVVLIPHRLIRTPEEEPPSAPTVETKTPEPVTTPEKPASSTVAPGGLPQRRRGETLATTTDAREQKPSRPSTAQPATGSRFNAFRRGRPRDSVTGSLEDDVE